MKKQLLILSAIIGIFFFNSCKEENDNTDLKPVSKSINFQNIKNYVGDSFSRVNGYILIKGYKQIEYSETNYENNLIHNYVYLSKDSAKYIKLQTFNNIVFACEYHYGDMYVINTTVDNVFSEYKNLSNEANNLFSGYNYTGFLDEDSYSNHQDLIYVFDSVKYDMNWCDEKWEENNIRKAKVSYFNEDYFLPVPPYPINHVAVEYWDYSFSPYINFKSLANEDRTFINLHHK